jgi:hypothetical protein
MNKLRISAFVLAILSGIFIAANRSGTESSQTSTNIADEELYGIRHQCQQMPEKPTSEGKAQVKDYPALAADELANLQDGVSLGDWKRNRPDEKVVVSNPTKVDPNPEHWKDWCARAEKRLSLPSGREALRYAFFYSPSPPSNFVLPEDKEKEILLERCLLGLIWVTGPAGVADGNLLARDAGRVISARFGEPEKNSRVSFFGSAFWGEITRWRSDQAIIISAWDGSEYRPLAFGFLPNSGLNRAGESDYFTQWDTDHVIALSRIRKLMETAGITGSASQEMEEILQLNEAWQKGLRPDNSKMLPERVVQTLGRWLDKTTPLSPSQKAAAVLAADQVLVEVQHSFKVSLLQEGAAAREALSKFGAAFNDHESLGGGVLYIQNWLSVAQRMDADGPIGDLTFRMFMEKGFDTSGECRGGSAQYEKVIKKGEEYLKNPHDSVSRRAVELMVAEAHRDIVGLAEGLGREYADPQDYKDAAPGARRKAIEHFRAALLQAPDTLENRAAWSDAWRLIAGLPPSRLRYFCVYD